MLALMLFASGCSPEIAVRADASETTTTSAPTTTSTTTTSTTTTTTTTTTTIPTFPLTGSVVTRDGLPLPGATVTIAGEEATTGADGTFALPAVAAGRMEVAKPAWMPATVEFDGASPVEVTLEPRVVRALRAIPEAAGDPEAFTELIAKAEASAVNTIVFDTKDETGKVRYVTSVAFANEIDAVDPTYDPVATLAAVHERGMYAVARLVTFEDQVWVKAAPDAKLAGLWVDATNPGNWEYPLAVAVEACELGFDEIQFDYVRFPAGRTAEAAQARRPLTADERVAAIAAFLTEARARVHAAGCAISADVFAIVVSSPTDEGIGQRPEELSAVVDAISPMVYPSHYSPGWLGFPDPNDYPGPVTADAIDDALRRIHPTTILRPWLQAFYYSPAQIQAGIAEAEARGVGWMLWNAAGNYNPDALPAAGDDGG